MASDGSGDTLRPLVAGADSVALSLNKGLGAPLGAVLAGDAAFIAEAVRVRHLFGGTWRPIGLVAAAALPAVDGFHARIAADHRRARRFFAALRAAGTVAEPPETNLVMVRLATPGQVESMLAALAARGVLALRLGDAAIRFAFHAGIADDDADAAAGHVTACLPRLSRDASPEQEFCQP